MQKQYGNNRAKLDVAELIRLHRQFRVHKAAIRSLVEEFYIALDSPISLSCYLLFKYEQYDDLVEKEVDPHQYNDWFSFRSDLTAVSFLRKNSSLKTSYQKKERALTAFAEAEVVCQTTNLRLNPYYGESIHPDNPIAQVLKGSRRKIYKVLQRFDVGNFLSLCTWGPGSTLLVKGSGVSASHKFDIETQMTRDAHFLFHDLLSQWNPRWERLREVDLVAGNKVVTVPKNAKIDRTIAIEPGLNSWIQLGIGKLIRKRLRRAGIDLNSDLRNHDAALRGSLHGHLATIDFRAASDTIAIRTVEKLLPPEWFSILDSARSQWYKLGSDIHQSQKFSTMGNGFTFELESLIFYSVGVAVCDFLHVDSSAVCIFGDDLILPVECTDLANEVFSYLGFTINLQKSFSSSYFRESCGSYFFNGVDVKPFFLKKDPYRAKDLYRFANSIRSLAHTWGFGLGCDSRFKRVWQLAVDSVPKELRFFGPESSGDATIHVDLNDRRTQKASGQLEGFVYPGFPEVSISTLRDSDGVLLAKLFRPSTESQGNEIPDRARTKICFKKRMFAHRWCDTLGWLKP